jgi:hypothetical protein
LEKKAVERINTRVQVKVIAMMEPVKTVRTFRYKKFVKLLTEMLHLAQSLAKNKRMKTGDHKFRKDPGYPPLTYSTHEIVEIVEADVTDGGGNTFLRRITLDPASHKLILIAENWKKDKRSCKPAWQGSACVGTGSFKYGVKVRICAYTNGLGSALILL